MVEINKTKQNKQEKITERHVRKCANGKVSERQGRNPGDLCPMKCAEAGLRELSWAEPGRELRKRMGEEGVEEGGKGVG